MDRPGHGQLERWGEGLALAHSTGVGLLVGDFAVAIGIEAQPSLERRDLGLVHDDVEQDPIGLDPHARVVVDREVAEGVGERHGRQDQDQSEPD